MSSNSVIQKTLIPSSPWYISTQSNPIARKLADRHYSRKTIGAPTFMGPGECLILLTYDENALFGWRKNKYRLDNQEGVECSIFRNEGKWLSSLLILEAEIFAYNKWAPTRLFTYINSKKIRSTNPGACFLIAGWKREKKRSKNKKLILLSKKVGPHNAP